MDRRRTGLSTLVRRFGQRKPASAVREVLRSGGETVAAGLWGSAGALLLAALAPSLRRPPTLVVTEDDNAADDLKTDLRIFLDDEAAAREFPGFDQFEGNGQIFDFPTLAGRLTILQLLLDGAAPRFLVAPVAALLQPVPEPDDPFHFPGPGAPGLYRKP